MVRALIARVTVQPDSISVEQAELAAAVDGQERRPNQTVVLRWSRKPFRAAKGAIGDTVSASVAPRAGQPVLAAIGRAKRWADEIMAGGTAAEIADQERKSERLIRMLIPLAFASPNTVQGLIAGRATPASITQMAKTVPLVWT